MIIAILLFLVDEADWIKTDYIKQARITINSNKFHQKWFTNNKDRRGDFKKKK